jgi:hypothetical protein
MEQKIELSKEQMTSDLRSTEKELASSIAANKESLESSLVILQVPEKLFLVLY